MDVGTSDRRIFPSAGRGVGLCLMVVATMYLTISPLTLLTLGYNYEDAGGTFLEKIHPATFAACGTLLIAALLEGNPLSALAAAIERYPGTTVFVAMIGVLIVHSVQIVGLPFTFFFDTFLAPVVVFFLYKDPGDGRALRLTWLIHTLMIVNAVIGILEFATGERLTPLVASGLVIDDDWRSTALFGHPLANASLTGAYILALACGAARDLPRALALGGFVISAAGMVVFGGRASTVILLGMLAIILAGHLLGIVRGKTFQQSTVLTMLLVLPMIALAFVSLEEIGFFDQFIERFVDDKGSADARVEMFSLFQHLSWYELLFAPDAVQLTTLKRIYNLDFGIESFWISFVLSYGLIPGLAFFGALFLFCRDIARTVGSAGVWLLIFFFILASTSVSLSSKTPVFAVLVLMIVVLLRTPVKDPATVNQAARQPAGHPPSPPRLAAFHRRIGAAHRRFH